MSTDSSQIRAKLAKLSSDLDVLELHLLPILSQPLEESIIDLEPLQQAKLQTVLPYTVYDLVFMYLKLEGIDPRTHPVVPELDRVRQYFDKISTTENPPVRKSEIDKEAAGRFIKNAISQVKWTKTAAEAAQDDEPVVSGSSSKVPVKTTSEMLERRKYEELRQQDAGGEDEDDASLEAFDDSATLDKATNVMAVDQQPDPRKRRGRPSIDLFSGEVDTSQTGASSNTEEQSTSNVPDTPSVKKKKSVGAASTDISSTKKSKRKSTGKTKVKS